MGFSRTNCTPPPLLRISMDKIPRMLMQRNVEFQQGGYDKIDRNPRVGVNFKKIYILNNFFWKSPLSRQFCKEGFLNLSHFLNWWWKRIEILVLCNQLIVDPKQHFFPDINECSYANGGCEQICQNEDGAYSCSCRPGFKLSVDKRSCVGKKRQKLLKM